MFFLVQLTVKGYCMKKFILFLLLIIIGFISYSFYLAPKIIHVNEYTISDELIPSGFDGFKIVHFSDLKYTNESPKILNKLVKIINEQQPDLILFTGDLIDNKLSDKNQKELLNSLNKMDSKLGKYAILGDKDKDTTKDFLLKSNFLILEDDVNIYNNDIEPITLSSKCDYEEPPENYTICLIHEPDKVDNISNYKPSLILAGHNLGGQIKLPFWGPLVNMKGAKKYTND